MEGTTEGIWCMCFLVLTWNMKCRTNSTARVKISDISWRGDGPVIVSESERHCLHGDSALFYTCPIFALKLYLATFGAEVNNNSLLFPGHSQNNRFATQLEAMLTKHADELSVMGYADPSNINTHSIRKGAIKWFTPSAVSFCINNGISMGAVRDAYLTW